MHTSIQTTAGLPAGQGTVTAGSDAHTAAAAYSQYQIIRRNGAVVPFEPNKIAVAMMKAFLAVHGSQGAASASVRETVGPDPGGDPRSDAFASWRRHFPY